jgi:hypothetical protein
MQNACVVTGMKITVFSTVAPGRTKSMKLALIFSAVSDASVLITNPKRRERIEHVLLTGFGYHSPRGLYISFVSSTTSWGNV